MPQSHQLGGRLKAGQVVVVEPSQCQCCIEATLLPNSGGTTSLVFTHRPPSGLALTPFRQLEALGYTVTLTEVA